MAIILGQQYTVVGKDTALGKQYDVREKDTSKAKIEAI